MNKEAENWLIQRGKSFVHAIRGSGVMLSSEPNARIHLAASLAVILLGLSLPLSGVEWCLLVFAMAVVWITEALNTAVEFLADAVTEEYEERIKNAKDVAATAVLLSAISAAIVGGIVFVPHF